MSDLYIKAQLIDILHAQTYPVAITVRNGKVHQVQTVSEAPDIYVLPGLVDAHVHVESSMLVPSEFARLAVTHGTVCTVSDPHEIGNVLGVEGVHFMIENGKKTNFKFHFGAPSCVPATPFETAGATIDLQDIRELFTSGKVEYLAEMMNWPAVLHQHGEVMEKIKLARSLGLPVDGHAPGLMGDDAKKYIGAGISTDHECFTAEEAESKLKLGMKILIREGSAAKNFEALCPLIDEHYEQMMFCSDDKHPDSLVEGHIDALIRRGLAKGIDLYKLLRLACINPVQHYGLPVGMLREGDPADFILIDSPDSFRVKATYINGEKVAEDGRSLLPHLPTATPNNFHTRPKQEEDFAFDLPTSGTLPVIEALDGQLITNRIDHRLQQGETQQSLAKQDILKMTVVNRYADEKPSIAFIKNFGIRNGAIASSVAHDSHNIVAVGVSDEAIAAAVNLVIKSKGGLSAVSDSQQRHIPLPVAGLMSDADGYQLAKDYTALDQMVKQEMGSTLGSPFMTLSFMALLVIPKLKLSDIGLFDGERFEFVEG